MVILVILRLCLGWHFFYEGVWKINHRDKFSAAALLRTAKGPAAECFQKFIPDNEGRARLKIERVARQDALLDAWRTVRDESEKKFRKTITDRFTNVKRRDTKDAKARLDSVELLKVEQLITKRQNIMAPLFWAAEDKLDALLENEGPAMVAALDARDAEKSKDKLAAMNKRAAAWLTEIAKIQDEYLEGLTKAAEENKNKDFQNAVAAAIKEKAPPIYVKGADVAKQIEDLQFRNAKGHEILRVDTRIRADKFYKPWNKLRQKVVDKFSLTEPQQFEAEVIYRRYKESVRTTLDDNRDDVAVYFAALKRFDEVKASGNRGAAHQKERFYDQQQKLRGEVNAWLTELEETDKSYQTALEGLLTAEQAKLGSFPTPWSWLATLDLIMIFSLTAIGLCLLLGLFTRPAALGGAAFMFSVVLVQFPWPTIYPPAPAVVGHALLINKDFIEMVALLLIASTAAGRWGGLDYFVENSIIRLWKCCNTKKGKAEKETK